jgi:putative ABC transport system permease protein
MSAAPERDRWLRRLCLGWISALRWLVPSSLREEWRDEWHAEIWHRLAQMRREKRPRARDSWDLFRRCLSGVWHALWLRRQEWSLDMLWNDLRDAMRQLRRQPGFTLLVVAVLAVGIGANTILFSVVHAVLLRPLDLPEPERLVSVHGSQSMPDILDWNAQAKSFEGFGGFANWGWDLAGEGDPEPVQGVLCSASLLQVLRPRMLYGRVFGTSEDVEGGERVALVGERFWRRHLGADPEAVGRQVRLSGRSYTVLGVVAAGSSLDPDWDAWVPIQVEYAAGAGGRAGHFINAVGRLGPGVELAQAQAELSAIVARLEAQYPESNKGQSAPLEGLQRQLVGQVRPTLLVLAGAVGLVLLIACANVANLLLVRAAGRSREMALRMAIGAARGRILRQLLTESLLLGLAGCAGGLLLANLGLSVALALAPQEVPRLDQVGLDATVLGFAVAVSLLTGLLFGLAPALAASRTELGAVLQEGRRSGPSRESQRMRGALVVAEIALALVLLVGAGLLLRSLVQMQEVDPGFDPRNVATLRVSLPEQRYPQTPEQILFTRQALERLQAVPGVVSAAMVSDLALTGESVGQSFVLETEPDPPPGEGHEARARIVSERYLEAMRVRLLAGRNITEADSQDAPLVVLVNETLARRHFAGSSPLGQRLAWGSKRAGAEWATIVGVVGDARYLGLTRDEEAAVYVPYAQRQSSWKRWMSFVLRTEVEPQGVLPAAKAAIWSVDPELAVRRATSMEALLARNLGRQRFATLLLGLFAAMALLLALVGVYGVMSAAVTRRTSEIGVRMALGAQPRDVLRLVLGQSLRLTLLGVALGLGGAIVLSRLLESLLFQVSATDPATFLGVALLAVHFALLAAYLPSRRASRIDPCSALRHE